MVVVVVITGVMVVVMVELMVVRMMSSITYQDWEEQTPTETVPDEIALSFVYLKFQGNSI